MSSLAALCVSLAMLASPPQQASEPQVRSPIAAETIDAAIEKGARWLRDQQREDGAFAPDGDQDVCIVALTAMATWSLNEPEPRCLAPEQAERAVRFLVSNRRQDGGIYDPSRGLAVYTTGVAARALRTLGKRDDWPELAAVLAELELYTYRRVAPESIVDAVPPGQTSSARSTEVARSLLEGEAPADDSRRKALEFLARCERDGIRLPSRLRTPGTRVDPAGNGAFSYDDLLPFVYFDVAPEHQLALRARDALRAHYTPERNPDLTRRYGDAGFVPGTQGLYYYYYVVAKALTTFRERTLVTSDGASHDWADELASRLVRSQRASGAWANSDPHWWESEPVLATSYALLTLKLCRASSQLAASGR